MSQFLYSQKYHLKINDTIEINMLPNKNWIEVSSQQADLSIGIYSNNQLLSIENHSRGIHSYERINLANLRNQSNIKLKIWANAYLQSARNIDILIKSTHSLSPIKTKLNTQLLSEDLEYFINLRKNANSGLYTYRSEKQIDSIYQWARKEVSKSTSIIDFYKIITVLTNFEGSCHNATFLPNSIPFYSEDVFIPIVFKNLENELFCNTSATPIPLGSKIISINNRTSKELIKQLSKYYNADGFSHQSIEIKAFERNFWETYFLEYGTPKVFNIEYEHQNLIKKIALKPIALSEIKKRFNERHSLSLDQILTKEKYSFKKLQDNIYQLSIRGFDFAGSKTDTNYLKFEQFLENVVSELNADPKNELILDLRYNTGGAGILYEKVYSYFTNRPFRDSFYANSNFNMIPFESQFIISSYLISNQIMSTTDANPILKTLYPNEVNGKYYISDEKNPLLLPNKNTFNGKIYLIIDEKVASAGSHLASLVKSYTNATVIGKETNGGYYIHNGHLPVEYSLPHTGIITMFSILNVTQDAEIKNDQPFGSGVRPHFYINENVNDFLSSTDTYLNETLNIILKNKKTSN